MFEIGTVIRDKITGKKGIVVGFDKVQPDYMYVLIRNKYIYNTLETRQNDTWEKIGYFPMFEEIVDSIN